MKKYNIDNYLRYKDDVKKSILRIQPKQLKDYTRDELIIMFLPLVENIARKFSTADQASGIMDITDLLQEGSIALILAIDNIEWDKINESEDEQNTLRSFLSKRIKGSIRRSININRGSIRIPEYKLNEIRNNPDDKKMVEMFFNSIFESVDIYYNNDDSDSVSSEHSVFQYEDKSKEYNIDLLNIYLFSLFNKYLTKIESEVLRLSYGLDCDRYSGVLIAEMLNFKGPSAYVRISELKKSAISKLIANVESSQVLDYM